jgi:hypothetical protein
MTAATELVWFFLLFNFVPACFTSGLLAFLQLDHGLLKWARLFLGFVIPAKGTTPPEHELHYITIMGPLGWA